jgi:predicted Zn-dependent protease
MNFIKFSILLVFLFIVGCTSSDNKAYFTSSFSDSDLFSLIPKASKPEAKYGYFVYLSILSDQALIVSGPHNDRVQKIGKSLVCFVERPYFPYTFTILNDSRIFATSTPGGYVYLSQGMIDFCQSDSELAAILAHELAQIQHKRMRFTISKKLANFAQSTASSASFLMGPYGVAVPKGLRLVNNVLLKEKSRLKRTIVSDRLALKYLENAHFDPVALYELVSRIATIEGSKYTDFRNYVELRPITQERIRKLKT